MAGRTAADVKYPAAVLDVGRICQQLRSGNSRRDRFTPEYNDSDNGAGSRNDCDFYHRRTIRMILRVGPLLGPNSIIPRLPEANATSKKEIGPRGRLFPRC